MFDCSIHPYSVLSDSRRIVAISDIHGNFPVFKKLSCKIAFDPEEGVLFLVGDLLEKGPCNLETLYYIMELSRHSHVHPTIGSCDVVCRSVLCDTRPEFLQNILLSRPNSILRRMAQRVDQRIDKETDMATLSRELREVLLRELTFTDRLLHVIEIGRFIFTHAGIRDERTYGCNMRDIMVQNLLIKGANSFHRYIVVGHLPISEYRKDICCFDPITDTRRHIISINGGNEVKSAGQLNTLIYEWGRFQFTCNSRLKGARITRDILPVNRTPFFITQHEGQVHILRDEGACCLCRYGASDKVVHIVKEFLFYRDKELHAYDFTSYQIPARCGNLVEIVPQTRGAVLVKKQGLMGWIPADALALEN